MAGKSFSSGYNVRQQNNLPELCPFSKWINSRHLPLFFDTRYKSKQAVADIL